ncbi:ABC transporter permease [Carboxydothermus hydrogenoformans]|uniref:ABC transporter, permease protein n=1 Tax=Carboxydothermus hydrogenoformans (strain ATCC BAA-161 / DSM 6008 / Z-2901) TaxID=246194 RepID=Q3AA37_CARHZ|nr:ABC transporter permease [Carboxydothermus hydrogenoformans]ABB13678.1 ABC transporter, permease protein [Carboxydothermus hydrogenoformans Z-2901]
MVIGKIPGRIIRKNKAQYVGTIFLIFIAVVTYLSLQLSMENITENYRDFKEKYRQESAHFSTLKPVDVSYFEQKYNLSIEERFQKDVEWQGKTLRVLSKSQKVNLPYLSREEAGDVIYIDPLFLKANGLKIGDTITFGGKKYKIAGSLALPDYIYIIKNDSDLLNDPNEFGIAVLPTEEVKTLGPVPYHYYMVRGKITDEFVSELSANASLLSLQKITENPRVYYVDAKIKGAKIIATQFPTLLLVVASVLLFTVLRRQIGAMQQEIGALFALGYTSGEVLRALLGFPFYLWLFGSVLGCVAGIGLAIPLARFYAAYFNIPIISFKFLPQIIITGLLLPAVFIFPVTYLALRGMMKRPVLELIKGLEKGRFKKPFLKIGEGTNFLTRMALKQGAINAARGIILIVGIAFATFLLAYGLAAKDSIGKLMTQSFGEVFHFQYQYLLTSPLDQVPEGAESFTVVPAKISGTKINAQLYGIKPGSRMVTVRDKGGMVKLGGNGIVISKPLSEKTGLVPGQLMELETVGKKKLSLDIVAVADITLGNTIFIYQEDLNKLLNLPDNYYNGLWSNPKLTIPEDKLVAFFDKQYLNKALENTAKPLEISVSIMGMVAILFALAVIFVLTSLIIQENRRTISLLKILGWSNNEVNFMILGSNDLLFLAGFVLGIPLFYRLFNYLMAQATKVIDFSFNMIVSAKTWGLVFGVLLLTWLFAKFLNRRKIAAIPPGEILKEQVD